MSSTTDLIRQLQALGLKQSEIAKRTGILQPRLSRWSAGQAPVGADDALKLQALLTEVTAVADAARGEAGPELIRSESSGSPSDGNSHAPTSEPSLQGVS